MTSTPPDPHDTGFAQALKAAHTAAQAGPRPGASTSELNWPTRKGPLRPSTTTNTSGVG